MLKIVSLLLVVGLWGCKASQHEVKTDILLSVADPAVSKTDALTAGDEVAVFARIEGTERYFLEGAKFITGADGHTLNATPAAYYPETKQAITFYTYFPYHTGSFSVPTDQSTASALKQADLCWAMAQSTPVSGAVPLAFRHVLARLVVSVNEPTSKIVVPNAFVGGALDVQTGAFTNTLKSELSTTQDELILPAQTLSRLMITVSGGEYAFEGSVVLESGKTTSISLMLNPSTKTASLSGSSVSDWLSQTESGAPTEAVSNILTLHWLEAPIEASLVDKVVLSITNSATGVSADYTVSEGLSYAGGTFTAPFAASGLGYPYQITKAAFYQGNVLVPPMCEETTGGLIYKSGAAVVGLKGTAQYVQVGDLYWATGNLVATSPTAGKQGLGGCTIGAPTDGGLYFLFGSLIGWKGGATANGGTGQGMPDVAWSEKWWNGAAAWSWANDAMVWPSNMSGTPAAWPQNATTNQWYFGLQKDWSTAEQNIRDYPGLVLGGLSGVGVGDPCTYYLGGTWRLPTTKEHNALFDDQSTRYNQNLPWGSVVGASWVSSGVTGGSFQSNKLFFPASGVRLGTNGLFREVTASINCWSSSIYDATGGIYMSSTQSWMYPQYRQTRSMGYPVRCVADLLAVDVRSWVALPAGGSRVVNVEPFDGESWTVEVVGANGPTLSTTSGVGRGLFTMTYGANANVRSAVVRVTGGGTSVDIPVSQASAVQVGNVYWATGNLVASSSTAGPKGAGGCTIGAPGDGGLYFQFGSLIGYKGGAQTNGGTGVGMPQAPLTTSGTYWNGSGYTWASDAMVWPSELVGTKTSWANTTGSGISTLSDYYFNYSVAPWETSEKNIRDFAVSISGDSGSGTLATGRYAKQGVGDPCTYYLGGTWRMPTSAEYKALCNNQGGGGWVPWATAGGSWTTSPTYGGNFSSNRLFFPASGYRHYSSGSFNSVTTSGNYWSSSVYNATYGYTLYFTQPNGVLPQRYNDRSNGFPVRCVSSVP